jgi:hypothetical protein
VGRRAPTGPSKAGAKARAPVCGACSAPQTTAVDHSADLLVLVERVTRIELALSAWEADVLPLNYTRARPSVQLWLGTSSWPSARLVIVPEP